jgi:hypothetical protein
MQWHWQPQTDDCVAKTPDCLHSLSLRFGPPKTPISDASPISEATLSDDDSRRRSYGSSLPSSDSPLRVAKSEKTDKDTEPKIHCNELTETNIRRHASSTYGHSYLLYLWLSNTSATLPKVNGDGEALSDKHDTSEAAKSESSSSSSTASLSDELLTEYENYHLDKVAVWKHRLMETSRDYSATLPKICTLTIDTSNGQNRNSYHNGAQQGQGKRQGGKNVDAVGTRRYLPEQDGDDGDDDNDNPDQRNLSNSNNSGDASNKKLACPFFKHNPQKYQNNHSCTTRGWLSVHRVK